jgi:hypothetical protein
MPYQVRPLPNPCKRDPGGRRHSRRWQETGQAHRDAPGRASAGQSLAVSVVLEGPVLAVSRRVAPGRCSRRSRSHHSGSTGRWTRGWPPQATAARAADSADMSESALGHPARLRLPRPHGAARDRDAPCPGRHGEAAVALHADTDLRGRPVVDQFHLPPTEGTGGEHLTQIRKSVTHGPRQNARARPLLDLAGGRGARLSWSASRADHGAASSG